MPPKHLPTTPEINKLVIKALKLKPVPKRLEDGHYLYNVVEWVDKLGRIYFREFMGEKENYKTSEYTRRRVAEYNRKEKEMEAYVRRYNEFVGFTSKN